MNTGSAEGHELVYLLDWRPAGRCYVGKTNNLKRRLSALRRERLSAVWRVHGEPRVEVLHRCVLRAEVFVLEPWEIAGRGTLKPNGYNQSAGAEGRTVDDLRQWVDHCDFPRLSPAARRAWEWIIGHGPGPDGRPLNVAFGPDDWPRDHPLDGP